MLICYWYSIEKCLSNLKLS